MTSPVERISGPSSESEPAKRLKGNTASLTEVLGEPIPSRSPVCPARRATPEHDPPRASPAAPRSPSRRTAPCAMRAGSPRGRTARPLHGELDVHQADDAERQRELARRLGIAEHSAPSECGGSTQALSPEWMPASSMCCMIPPITRRCRRTERPRRPRASRGTCRSATRLSRLARALAHEVAASSSRVVDDLIPRPPST